MTYRDRAFKQYQTIVQKLWQIFAKHGLINSQVNVLLALSQDRQLYFSGLSFGPLQSTAADQPVDYVRNLQQPFAISIYGITNQQIQQSNKCEDVQRAFNASKHPRSGGGVEQELSIFQRLVSERREAVRMLKCQKIALQTFFNVRVRGETLKQAIQMITLRVKDVQQYSSNEDQVKVIIAQKDKLGSQKVQQYLELIGTSPFATCSVNALALKWRS